VTYSHSRGITVSQFPGNRELCEAPNMWLCDDNPQIDVSLLTGEATILVISS